MDYEFRRDGFGGYRALFSMGHEAIGQWLIDEVGKDDDKVDELLTLIDRLSARQLEEYHLPGRDYSLTLTQEEAEVKANVLNISLDEDLDDLAYYDDEQLALCGLEDFAAVLTSWRAFVRNEDW
ncbi:hypothetical protein SAMN05880558_1198 [Aeromonas sp. RU39B]|uniref:UPF0231 family protein n=1 Tax=Aeromonas sp. RU39B TaxID=1907416 RepID=UPI0009558FE5|nr:YacL family protein [Aeromonas sp. RU39B]SIR60267.1 hypothetical protein SAMN05880558_1198 [Aeromonas sp. RU39B]